LFAIFECGFNVCYWLPEKQTCLSGIIELPVDFYLAVFVAAVAATVVAVVVAVVVATVAAAVVATVAAFFSELEV
jgi:hypothetical protein